MFHYKPSILGYPYFWKHPYRHTIIPFWPAHLSSHQKFATFQALTRQPGPSPSRTEWHHLFAMEENISWGQNVKHRGTKMQVAGRFAWWIDIQPMVNWFTWLRKKHVCILTARWIDVHRSLQKNHLRNSSIRFPEQNVITNSNTRLDGGWTNPFEKY